jgi:hypothetical protein
VAFSFVPIEFPGLLERGIAVLAAVQVPGTFEELDGVLSLDLRRKGAVAVLRQHVREVAVGRAELGLGPLAALWSCVGCFLGSELGKKVVTVLLLLFHHLLVQLLSDEPLRLLQLAKLQLHPSELLESQLAGVIRSGAPRRCRGHRGLQSHFLASFASWLGSWSHSFAQQGGSHCCGVGACLCLVLEVHRVNEI